MNTEQIKHMIDYLKYLKVNCSNYEDYISQAKTHHQVLKDEVLRRYAVIDDYYKRARKMQAK